MVIKLYHIGETRIVRIETKDYMYHVRLPHSLSLINAIFVQFTHILHFEKGCPVDELVKTIKNNS